MANPNPSPENRFRPGERHNPGGRPKGRSLTSILREALDADAPPTDGTNADRLVGALIAGALAGDPAATKELWARAEGKVPDRQELSGGLVVRVEYGDVDAPAPPPRPA